MKHYVSLVNFSKTSWFQALFILCMITITGWLAFSTTNYFNARALESKKHEFEMEHATNLPDYKPESEVVGNLSIDEIKMEISRANREMSIRNSEKYGPLNAESVVIVVQVHDRLLYLKHLIDSLRNSSEISEALLVFSHDIYDEEINNAIKLIDFCKVLQIFYPYSIQTHPDEFPGPDSKDCTSDTPQDDAIKMKCQNAFYRDKFGHYRKAELSQLKHHWWWKANQVFNLAEIKNSYDGPVLFLEEDLYVVDDFIPTLKLMYETASNSCQDCKIISLAENQDAISLEMRHFDGSNKAIITKQFSNMGLSFNRHTWFEILGCTHSFCFFDDCNWDYSLQHLYTTCVKNSLSMTLGAPRVFHIGNCGTHFKNVNCDPQAIVNRIKTAMVEREDQLYPKRLFLVDRNLRNPSYTSYGGWGDPRDQSLCLGMTVT